MALRLTLLPALVTVALLVAWRLGYFDLARREHLVTLIQQARHTSWANARDLQTRLIHYVVKAQPITLEDPERAFS